VLAVVAVAVGGGVVVQIVENGGVKGGIQYCRVAVRAGRKLDDDDTPANSSVEHTVPSAQYITLLNKGSVVENEVRIIVLHARQGTRCHTLYDSNVREGGHDDEVGSWSFQMGQMRTRARPRARHYSMRWR